MNAKGVLFEPDQLSVYRCGFSWSYNWWFVGSIWTLAMDVRLFPLIVQVSHCQCPQFLAECTLRTHW